MAIGQVLAHHLGQLVGLALEREGRALDLLVVLELDLEQADHLDRHAGRPGDGHGRVAVGREDLLHGVVGDDVARRGPAVARHHDAVGVAQGHHRGAVGRQPAACATPRRMRAAASARPAVRRRRPTKSGPGSRSGGKSGSATGGYCPPFCT